LIVVASEHAQQIAVQESPRTTKAL
jgi:hypothetical protein